MLPPINWPLLLLVLLITFILLWVLGLKGIWRWLAAAGIAFLLYTPANNQLRLFAFSNFKQVVSETRTKLVFENVGNAHAKMLVARLLYGASRVKCEGGLRSKAKAIPYELKWEGGFGGFFEVQERPGLTEEFLEYFGLFRPEALEANSQDIRTCDCFVDEPGLIQTGIEDTENSHSRDRDTE